MVSKVTWVFFILWCLIFVQGDGNHQEWTNKLRRRRRTGTFEKIKYLDYNAIEKKLKQLEKSYPEQVQVFDAQSRYKLPSPGRCGARACLMYVLKITNEKTLPDASRPEVFFSGEVHGNERVGPTTVMTFAELLLKEYNKENGNPWIKRLVDTRSIVIMPSANALGYYQNTREENGVDINRDFPIDRPRKCMETVGARAINEVWREHLFQVALTYHGGQQAIGFEWGTTTMRNHFISPDHRAQSQLGSAMSAFAGAYTEGRYSHNPMDKDVYPVRGGMEDWAYSRSWDNSQKPCQPSTFGGYSKDKTTYNSAQLRAFNMLIECSKHKTPSEGDLGTWEQLLRPEGKGDGHIPRNVRLALFMTDLVQPYIEWVQVPAGVDGNLTFAWEVGGAMFVDETYLVINYTLPNGTPFSETSEKQSGNTRWAGGGLQQQDGKINPNLERGDDIKLDSQDEIHDREIWPYIPAFTAQINIPEGSHSVSVVAVSRVDQNWALKATNAAPDTTPKSHLVNARTNPDWQMENNGHRIQGRLDWQSAELQLAFQDAPNETTLAGEDTTDAPAPTQSPTIQPAPVQPPSKPTGIQPKPAQNNTLNEESLEKVASWISFGMGFFALLIVFQLHQRVKESYRYTAISQQESQPLEFTI